ncbi:hypothetical protein [Moorena sp. SIO3I6]|uniref:hypothetical protein n=1 Tax=Moorena sp. SIO3I6 TaxID=2607831 RepID=UPI0013F7F3A2|nr:hypothetical protein [Moorena sp. SIO3I6]NEP21688.1 hypothetical protein [Moorena sp. SIO3I6]
MLFDAVVRYGTDFTNTCYGLCLGEPVPNTPYATVACSLFPIPYSLFPIPYSLFPIPCSLFPIH